MLLDERLVESLLAEALKVGGEFAEIYAERRRTDSLWPSLVAHMVNNGLAVAAAALLDR